MLKAGQWRHLYPDGLDLKISNILDVIQDTYQIDEDIGEDLCFIYATQTMQKNGMVKNKTVTLHPKRDDSSLLTGQYVRFLNKETMKMERRNLRLNDLELRVCTPKDKFVEHDIICGSKFMLMNI